MSSTFGQYSGSELLALELPARAWMVENIIREKDSVIVLGGEKTGKSVFMKQLSFALTSGQKFLDHYPTGRQYKVVEFQLEGELNDTQDRHRRMMITQSFNADNYHLFFYPPLELQSNDYRQGIEKAILKKLNGIKPDLVIIDPLYFAFSGSLSDDNAVRAFIGNLRCLKETLDCAIILVHHTHKTKWASDGSTIEEGDEALFGSKFFKAWADHILMFMYDKRRDVRILSCNTQRSGNILKECILKLVEPSPLYFEIVHPHVVPLKELPIIELLKLEENKDGLSRDDICRKIDISDGVFYKSIKRPLVDKIVVRMDGERPVRFRFNKEVS